MKLQSFKLTTFGPVALTGMSVIEGESTEKVYAERGMDCFLHVKRKFPWTTGIWVRFGQKLLVTQASPRWIK
jgi:hypothetical protein